MYEKMSRALLFVLFVIVIVENCETAKILGMFSAPVVSHQLVFKALMQELVKKGHQVTVVSTLTVKNDYKSENYTEITLDDIGTTIRDEILKKEFSTVPDLFDQISLTWKAGFKYVEIILKTDIVNNLIRNNSFDLIFIEDCTRYSLILSHLFKAPVILISSFGGSFSSFDIMGGTIHPILYPLATKVKFQNLSMWDKISDFYAQYRFQKMVDELEAIQDANYKKIYGTNIPTLNELKKNVHLLFLNTHSIWDSNRPVPPNVIYLGGLHQTSQKQLPKDLKLSLDSSKHGAIYMSFGTTLDTSSLTTEVLQIFINVFAKLPYNIYWKWNDDNITDLPKNIKMSSWFPQSDILGHPNMKLFITQGGLQSTDEAITAGVPLIGIPILWDQYFNVDKYVQFKIGVLLDIKTLTEDKLSNTIETVIENAEYRNNVINLRSQILDSPQTSMERAVWWTEYVLRRGATHLRPPSANMSWIDYYEIKIVLLLISIFLISIAMLFLILKYIVKIIMNKYHPEKSKVKIN